MVLHQTYDKRKCLVLIFSRPLALFAYLPLKESFLLIKMVSTEREGEISVVSSLRLSLSRIEIHAPMTGFDLFNSL